jgi:hypothetical protein
MQGALMNWRRLSSDFIFYAAFQFGASLLILWKYLHFSSFDFIKIVMGAVVVSMCIVGSQELNQARHRKVHRIHTLCVGAYFIISGGMFFVVLYTKAVIGNAFVIYFDSILVALAAKLLLVLYLNRNRKVSSSQPTTDNAS